MELKRNLQLSLVLLLFILFSIAVSGFTMEEALEGELVDVASPSEIKDLNPVIEESPGETNKSISKKSQQSSINQDTKLKEPKKEIKSDFAKYWYLIVGVGIIVLLIFFLIYRQNKKRNAANFGAYQNTYR